MVITYNIYGLILQRALSESLAFILFMTSYLIINDDLLVLNFLNFNYSIINDQFAFLTRILICVFSALYFLIIAGCLKEQKIISFEYPLIVLLSVLGLLLMCNSNDFLITYLAIELATLAFYVLASFQKTSNCSVDTAVKYFIIGAVSSAFFLLGSSFVYGFTGSINFSEFSVLLGNKFDWIYASYSDYESSLFCTDYQSPTSTWTIEFPVPKPRCTTCGPIVQISRIELDMDKRQSYPELFGECGSLYIPSYYCFFSKEWDYFCNSLIWSREANHPFYMSCVAYESERSHSWSYLLSQFYYYPRFGYYNGVIDLFFLKDYWKIMHQFGSLYEVSSNLPEFDRKVIVDFLVDKRAVPQMSYRSCFFHLGRFPSHLESVYSCRPFLSIMLFLMGTNNNEIDCAVTDYFLQKYCFYLKESINFVENYSFDNSFVEFGLILILFSLFMCDLLGV